MRVKNKICYKKRKMMKKVILYSLCIFSFLPAAQQIVKVQEWDPALYVRGNRPQYTSALSFLERNKIDLQNKKILDVGSGTGEISAFMAQKSYRVDGFDASNNMVEWAQKHHAPLHKNLSFKQCCVEDFSSDKKYDFATMFFCFHWFTDKEKAFKQTAESLKENGELFGTFSTSDLPQPPGMAIIKKMMEAWSVQTSFNESLGRSTVTSEELRALLTKTGFEIILCEHQTNDIIFNDRIDVENFTRPVMMSRPFVQRMSSEQREKFLAEYLDCIIPVLQDPETNQLLLKMHLTIVHARKKKSIS
jgi:2-polyprenyl-3-methyl-5-hydroxy-6-metoxy-1,4-benzoquinol methylase